MVADRSCDTLLEKAPNDDDKGKFKTDSRVVAIKEADIPDFRNPSHAKITTMRHLSDKDFAETLSGGDQTAYNNKVAELHAESDTGKAQAEIKERLKALFEKEEEAQITMEQSKTAVLGDLAEALENSQAAFKKLDDLEEENMSLKAQLEEAEQKCATLETVRAERDKALMEAGVIKKAS